MAALTHSYKPKSAYITFVKKRDHFIERHMPRRCMVVSTGLILTGLGIPLLRVIHLLPASLLLDFAGLGLIAIGGVLSLIFCGEI
jgi:hypothetical protein